MAAVLSKRMVGSRVPRDRGHAGRVTLPVVFALALAALAGCSRDDGATAQGGAAVPPSSPESYMKDGAFRSKLAEQTAKRDELAAARSAIVAQMTEMIEAKKRELKTDDEAKLKAALEKDPAWNELYKRCQDANAAIGENRAETMAAVRERLTKRGMGNGERGTGNPPSPRYGGQAGNGSRMSN